MIYQEIVLHLHARKHWVQVFYDNDKPHNSFNYKLFSFTIFRSRTVKLSVTDFWFGHRYRFKPDTLVVICLMMLWRIFKGMKEKRGDIPFTGVFSAHCRNTLPAGVGSACGDLRDLSSAAGVTKGAGNAEEMKIFNNSKGFL